MGVRRIPDLISATALATFVVAGAFFFPFTVDDAFIPARYGANLVEHGALVYNIGDRISALTSPLHGLVYAAIYAAAGDALITVWKILSALLVFAGVVAISRTTRDAWERATIAVFLLGSSAVVLWTWGGLETPILFALVAASVALIARPLSATRLAVLFVLSGVAFVARYDSVLFTVPVCAHAAWRVGRWSSFLRAAAIGAVVPVAWLGIAQTFYGDIWPTSYYVKAPRFPARNIQRNAVYMAEWLVLTGTVPLAALYLLNGRSRKRGMGWLNWPWAGVAAGMVLLLAYGLGVATHHMMFSFRHFVPYFPVLALVAAAGVSALERRFGPAAATTVLAAFVAGQCMHIGYTYTRSVNGAVVGVGEYRNQGAGSYADEFLRAMLEAGRDVRVHWAGTGKTRSPRIDTFAAGALPWVVREAYVFEPLVSFRLNSVIRLGPGWTIVAPIPERRQGPLTTVRSIDLRGASDYVHVLSPRHGSIERHLAKPVNEYELVSRHTIRFDGSTQEMLVFYDRDPTTIALPRTVRGE